MYGLNIKCVLLCGMVSLTSTGYGMFKKLELNRNHAYPVSCGKKAHLVSHGRKGTNPDRKMVVRGSGRKEADLFRHIQKERDFYASQRKHEYSEN